MSSPVALKLCYSLTSDPTQILDVPLPFLPKRHPPTATRAPPHRAEERQRNSQRVCNSWEKGNQHYVTSQQSATSSLYPDKYQWSRSKPRAQAERSLFLSLMRLPSWFPHTQSFAFLSAVIHLVNSQRALGNGQADHLSLVATARLLG